MRYLCAMALVAALLAGGCKTSEPAPEAAVWAMAAPAPEAAEKGEAAGEPKTAAPAEPATKK